MIQKTIENHLSTIVKLFLLLSVIGGYVYIFAFTINRGISVDEGYYLQGYVQYTVQSGVSNFHNIIKSICPFLDFEDALFLRWFYVVLSTVVFIIFAITAKYFLENKSKFKFDITLYYATLAFTWLLSYSFATPILYYDTLQLLIYLLFFSCLFAADFAPKYSLVLFLFAGFILPFSITNYLPAGLLLCFICFLWFWFNNKSKEFIGFVSLGFIVGVLFYHFRIHSLIDFFQIVTDSFALAQNNSTGHGTLGLLSGLFNYSGKVLLCFASVILVHIFIAVLENIKGKKITSIVEPICILGFIIASYFYKNLLGGVILFIPLFYLLFRVIRHKQDLTFTTLFLLVLFVVVPVFGVFGTNQRLELKMFYFLTFPVLGFLLLLFSNKISKVRKIVFVAFMCMQLAILFSYYGYFIRVHNYYGMKSSNSYLEGLPRLTNIKVAKHQKEYIERIHKVLKDNGFKKGDTILGFEVDLIPIYAVGGVVMPNNLFYGAYNMINNKANIPNEKLKYIVIYKREEAKFCEFMKTSDWDFPQSYQRVEIGKMAENMTNGQSSVLYIEKQYDSNRI